MSKKIKDISALQELRRLPNLESLNMQGNPVVKHPIYKALVLTALPNLTLHDGKVTNKFGFEIFKFKKRKHKQKGCL